MYPVSTYPTDRVIASLLERGLVTDDDLSLVLLYVDGMRLHWRMLLGALDLDDEVLYEEAARVYAIPEVDVCQLGTLALLSVCEPHLSARDWLMLRALNLLPVYVGATSDDLGDRLTFISHDPVHPDVEAFLEECDWVEDYRLCYGSRSTMRALWEAVALSGLNAHVGSTRPARMAA